MSNSIVRADHDQLKQIQSKFQSESESIQGMNGNLSSNIDTLQGGDWIGKGAQAFFQEMNNDVMPALKRLQQAMAAAASAVQRVSGQFQSAESEASNVLRGE